MQYHYAMVMWYSPEDEAYLVEAPELPGCMADGQSYNKTLENITQIIEEWIETARELGRKIPKPKGRLIYAY